MIKNIEDTRVVLNNLKLRGLFTVKSFAIHLGISVSALSNVLYSYAVGQGSLVSIWQKIEAAFTHEEIEAALSDVGSEDLTSICESLRTKVADLEFENEELRTEAYTTSCANLELGNVQLRARVAELEAELAAEHVNIRHLNDINSAEIDRLSERNRELRRDFDALTISYEIARDTAKYVDARWHDKYRNHWSARFSSH